jgi:hypothetical protein
MCIFGFGENVGLGREHGIAVFTYAKHRDIVHSFDDLKFALRHAAKFRTGMLRLLPNRTVASVVFLAYESIAGAKWSCTRVLDVPIRSRYPARIRAARSTLRSRRRNPIH